MQQRAKDFLKTPNLSNLQSKNNKTAPMKNKYAIIRTISIHRAFRKQKYEN